MAARDVLWERALDQHGYVTLRDAEIEGVARTALKMMVSRGTLVRVATGVYRFPELPEDAYAPYMLAVLWTGSEDACLSHDTALAVHELCDINPGTIHVTVPVDRRIRRRGGALYTVHNQGLHSDQVGWWEGVPTVTVPTAIEQGTATGVPTYLVRQALETAQRTGRATPSEIERLAEALEARNAHS